MRAHDEDDAVPYFPEHFLSELAAMLFVLAGITALCIVFPAGLDVKADPLATPVGAKPQWYFLFVSTYLRFVPPVVGTLTPVVATAALTLLPFLDRNPERRASKRVVAIAGALVLLVVIAVLTILGAGG